MKKQNVQAKLITNKSNIKYVSDFDGSSGFVLLTKKITYLFTDSRYIERAKNSVKKNIKIVDVTRVWRNMKELQKQWGRILRKHRIKTIGIEENDLTLAKFKKFKKMSKGHIGKIKFVDISEEIALLREVKTDKEIKLITKSQRINEKVFSDILQIIQNHQKSGHRKKLFEIDLVWKIKELAHLYGAEEVSFEPIVAFGKNSSIPHHKSGKTSLGRTDIVLIDMGMKYKGYCSDMTRTLLPKSPNAKQLEIYNLVLHAQKEGIKKISSKSTGADADFYSRNIIEKNGYGDNYTHSGGHGIGLDIHENPGLSENWTKKLKQNSVITVEPGIYIEGKFGVRIEDMILVTKNGNKNLTRTPK